MQDFEIVLSYLFAGLTASDTKLVPEDLKHGMVRFCNSKIFFSVVNSPFVGEVKEFGILISLYPFIALRGLK